MFEFSTVDKINHCIENNDIDKVKALVAKRNLRLTDSQSDFDILCIRLNLSLFSQNSKEEKTWKQEKIYVEFDKYIKDNYTSIIKELTIKYLNNHGGTCDSTDVEYFIINELRKDSELTTGPYKYTVMENKAVLKAIRKIYYSLSDEDAFFLCWGELSLR